MAYVTADASCIEVPEDRAQQLIAAWLDAAGLPPDCFPLTRELAAGVLAVAGYRVDEQELERLIRMGQTPAVAMYDAKDLLACAACLEARRQWQPNSVHAPKFHPQMLLLEQLLADGEDGLDVLRAGFANMDVRLAALLLTEAESREVREKMLSTLFALLAVQGIRV